MWLVRPRGDVLVVRGQAAYIEPLLAELKSGNRRWRPRTLVVSIWRGLPTSAVRCASARAHGLSW